MHDESSRSPASDVEILRRRGVDLGPGLSAAELTDVEHFLGFRLPPDLAAFLQEVLPLGKGFPNWRALGTTELRDQLEWPVEGIAFDIENNVFWWPSWGERPAELADAIALAREKVAEAPPLVPVFIHRYLPAEPRTAGNPVLSVYQTDIIYYGSDLSRYIAHEFGGLTHQEAITPEPRRIRFWSDVIDDAQL